MQDVVATAAMVVAEDLAPAHPLPLKMKNLNFKIWIICMKSLYHWIWIIRMKSLQRSLLQFLLVLAVLVVLAAALVNLKL